MRTHKHIHREDELSPNFHEQVVETADDAVVQALDAEAQRELQQVSNALRRLDSGTYPYCSKCGKEIGAERLTALPWTAHCIECA